MKNEMNTSSPQYINQPAAPRGIRGRFKRPNKRAVVAALAILLLAGVGFLAYKKYDDKASNRLPVYKYDAENKNDILWANHLIKGNGNATGMAFRLPLNGIVYSDSPYNRIDERLIPKSRNDVLIRQGLNAELGLRYVGRDRSVVFQSVIAGLILPPDRQNGFSKEDYFKGALNNLSFRLDSKDLSKVSFTLSGEKTFTNANIPSGAKIYQLTASSSGDSKVAAPIKRMVGELIEINGKNADYYLLISAMDSIWGPGGKSWQDIKNSLKVDQ